MWDISREQGRSNNEIQTTQWTKIVVLWWNCKEDAQLQTRMNNPVFKTDLINNVHKSKIHIY